MTTHRVLQISRMIDNLESASRRHRLASRNLRKIGNAKGASYYAAKAMRVERVLFAAQARVAL